ncbi:hypothetical protein NDU88_003149 [Pleurodeles waltl]|uniref:Uncharacterized protein n=1 Tax=Pleurodeles waltl TaxID=8319 RepID=A0AAV7TMP0_PLEWA|nr:hypothetical protein NDU88_003149 [Pleurodeles waltl]
MDQATSGNQDPSCVLVAPVSLTSALEASSQAEMQAVTMNALGLFPGVVPAVAGADQVAVQGTAMNASGTVTTGSVVQNGGSVMAIGVTSAWG